jgi:hypothetical protein
MQPNQEGFKDMFAGEPDVRAVIIMNLLPCTQGAGVQYPDGRTVIMINVCLSMSLAVDMWIMPNLQWIYDKGLFWG